MADSKVNDFPDSSRNDDLVAPSKTGNSDDEFERQNNIANKKRGKEYTDFKSRIALMEQQIQQMTSLNDNDLYDDSAIDSNISFTNANNNNNNNSNNSSNNNSGINDEDSNTIKSLNDELNAQQKILEMEQKSNINSNDINIENSDNKDNINTNDVQSDNKDHKDEGLPPDQYPKTIEEQKEIDSRSIFVSNLDKAADASEVKKHFEVCGPIERITIVCEKFNGKPKGCAYIQYKKKDSRTAALLLDGKEFNGVALKVQEKRTNQPRWMRGGGMDEEEVVEEDIVDVDVVEDVDMEDIMVDMDINHIMVVVVDFVDIQEVIIMDGRHINLKRKRNIDIIY
eukprot:CAMPEP_0114672426 /NCGR_PEP_ID=MMETSP0191-20121206/42898_1 /TAXON_ID=126664 /ORGANISM="Sorites sp." /LENGTH=339 /DNA_ID=CAMNT_0001934761 /DNA_START=11 /DNA_END=1031 /DNA_ORIENTATION=+